eukprot:6471716-Amphidinium_carterae.1
MTHPGAVGSKHLSIAPCFLEDFVVIGASSNREALHPSWYGRCIAPDGRAVAPASHASLHFFYSASRARCCLKTKATEHHPTTCVPTKSWS